MEALIAEVRLLLRRVWRSVTGFVERYGLNALPPAPTAVLVLLAGLAIPLAMSVDTRPTSLSSALAIERLNRFLEDTAPARIALSPSGRIVTARPVFLWKAVAGAAGYRFRLFQGDLLVLGTDLLDNPRYELAASKGLQIGQAYRCMVVGRDDAGLGMGGWTEAEFVLGAPDARLRDLLSLAAEKLAPAERALVLAGYHASAGRPHDLLSEAGRYLVLLPQGAQRPLVERVLEHLGH
ncbi:MAG: hypothetical protein ACYTGV_15715 [Planctomycetota bacterium]|jgi:hypothetical protein